MPTLHQNLRAAESNRFFDLLIDLIERDDVGIIIFLGPVERAELAIDIADVRVIDIAINYVGDDFVPASAEGILACELPASVGQGTQFFEWKMIQTQSVSLIDALSVPDFLQ